MPQEFDRLSQGRSLRPLSSRVRARRRPHLFGLGRFLTLAFRNIVVALKARVRDLPAESATIVCGSQRFDCLRREGCRLLAACRVAFLDEGCQVLIFESLFQLSEIFVLIPWRQQAEGLLDMHRDQEG